MTPETARRTWRLAEPCHSFIYFLPEARDAYAALGEIGPFTGYFASRSAPMGAVPPEVVTATFFNFSPRLVRESMEPAWRVAPPGVWSATRLAAVGVGLRRALGDRVGTPEIAELAGLLRIAAERACEMPEGRPLFAGHAALAWPEEPHLALWHAQSLLREFRGDGHIVALVAEGLSGIEALVTHVGSGDATAKALASSRAWSEEEWSGAVERLASRGICCADGTLTDEGRDLRARIEARTDELACAPYAALGEDGCARAGDLAREASRAVVDAGMFNFR